MATKNSVAAKTAKARTALVETPGTQASPPDPRQTEQVTKIVQDDWVLVNVPKGFTLTLDDGSPVVIRPGVQKLAKHLAEHWYSAHWGVTPFDPNTQVAD